MTSPRPVQLAQRRQREQVGRRAGVDEHAVPHAEPVATTPPRRPRTCLRLRQDRVVLLAGSAMTASRSSRVMLFCISGQSSRRPRSRSPRSSERPLELEALRRVGLGGQPAGRRALDQVAGGGGDRAARWDRRAPPAAGVVGQVVGAKPRRCTRRSRTPCSRSATGATISAPAPQLVQPLSTTSSRPVCSHRFGDRVDVERAEPDRDRSPRP